MVRPFEKAGASALRPGAGDSLEVRGAPAVVVGYEDRPPFVRQRLQRIAAWFGRPLDPARLSFTAIDSPLFAAPAGGRRDALPLPTRTYEAVWQEVERIGAGLLVIDPVGLALQTVGFDPGAVSAFMAALRRDAEAAGCGVGLVAHSTKKARAQDAPDNDPGVVEGSRAWLDRSRAVLAFKREKDGGARLAVVKAN